MEGGDDDKAFSQPWNAAATQPRCDQRDWKDRGSSQEAIAAETTGGDCQNIQCGRSPNAKRATNRGIAANIRKDAPGEISNNVIE